MSVTAELQENFWRTEVLGNFTVKPGRKHCADRRKEDRKALRTVEIFASEKLRSEFYLKNETWKPVTKGRSVQIRYEFIRATGMKCRKYTIISVAKETKHK